MTLFSTRKTRHGEESFQFRPSLNPSFKSLSKEYGVFSNRDVISVSGRWPRLTEVACVDLEVSWITLTNSFMKGGSGRFAR